MESLTGLMVLIGALWLAGYGTAIIAGLGGRYIALSKRPIKWMWTKHKVRIVWFLLGVITALSISSR